MKRVVFPLLIFSLFGCTTTQTQKLVVAEPMSKDLEMRVLRETGISGAAIGGLTAGAVGFGAGFLIATLAGADPGQAALIGAGTGTAAAVGGGIYGYQAGKRQGQKIVAASLRRDQLQHLLTGARAYNARLDKVNTQLRKELQKTRNMPDGPVKTKTSEQIAKVSMKEIEAATKRMTLRQKALSNPQWSNSQKYQYRQELNQLSAEKNELTAIYQAASKIAQK